MVQVLATETKDTSVFAGARFTSVSAGKIKELQEGFIFEFDFAKGGEETKIAYSEAVKGNLTKAQQLAKRSFTNTGVKKLSTVNNKIKGRYSNLSVKVPFILKINGGRSTYLTHSDVVNHYDGTSTEYEYSVYSEKKDVKFLSQRTKQNVSVSVALGNLKNSQNSIIANSFTSQYVANIESNDGYAGRLKNFLRFITRQSGLSDELIMMRPVPTEDLGFIRAKYELNLPRSFYNTVTKDSSFIKEVSQRSQREVNSYDSRTDRLVLCKSERNCERELSRKARSAVSVLERALKSLKKANASSKQEYVKKVTDAGKALTDNYFVLKAVLETKQACLLDYKVTVEGRKLSNFTAKAKGGKYCHR